MAGLVEALLLKKYPSKTSADWLRLADDLQRLAKWKRATDDGWFVRRDGKLYEPNPGQKLFHESKARFRALLGGRGGGKTTAGTKEAIIRVKRGLSGAVLNPDFENFKFSTWPEFRKWIPWRHVIPEDRHRAEPGWEPWAPFVLHFDTGAACWCKGLKDPHSARGPNMNWLWYDEGARDKTGEAWKIAIAGVRIGPDPAAWITTTPRSKRHWLHQIFVEGLLDDEVKALLEEVDYEGPLFEHFFAPTKDNLDNLDPLFYASLLSLYVGNWRLQELDGQFVDLEGQLAQRGWFEIVDAVPAGAKKARFWDLAATEKKLKGDDPDYMVGAKVARKGNTWFVEHMIRGRWGPGPVGDIVRQTAAADGYGVRIGIEQEPGAAGKILGHDLIGDLAGFQTKLYPATGDKVARAMPWLGQAQAGNVKLVRGPWNEAFLDEVEAFPTGPHDDQVDAVSGAFAMLNKATGVQAAIMVDGEMQKAW